MNDVLKYILEKRKSFKLHALITYRFLCGFKFGKTKVRWMSHEMNQNKYLFKYLGKLRQQER